MLGKFLRFAFVGTFATALHYAILLILVEGFTLAEVLASSIGFAVSSGFNYALNYRYTFQSTQQHPAAYSKFILVALAGLALNGTVLTMVMHYLELHYLWAQLAATGVVLMWNFTGNYLWSFRERAASTAR